LLLWLTCSLRFVCDQRSLEELGDMYGVEPNELALKAHRESIGLEAVSEKCFGAANIECVLLDDGLTMDRMLGMGWHRKYIRGVHRVLRIETVAEAVLNQPVVRALVPATRGFFFPCQR
jgi:hypothetical protein